ncbi:uncharacterized protein LOC114322385 [Camellia sinensis]|uniref:uncharacterized protein LOC114322385 n=1 Tax=Camellia sinensis TaxID=4442 RepID=UPI0010362B61|nr:uncharacterized protein LOC114322385 [Camellia sinensis]
MMQPLSSEVVSFMAIDEAKVSVLPEKLGLGQAELLGFSKERGSSSDPNSANMGGEAFNLLQSRWSDIVEMERGNEAVIDRFKDLPYSLAGTRARNLVSKLNQQPNYSSDKFGGELDLSPYIQWASGAQNSSTAVLEDGSWFIGGHFILLRKWHSMMKLSKDQLDKIPIWVKVFNVPMEYWDDDGLSRIASAIGEPLYMDRLTAHGDRVSFAKVCVEIGVNYILPTNFLIKCEGESIEVRVEYLWKPAKCTKCQVFCHANDRSIKTQVENIVQSFTEQQV